MEYAKFIGGKFRRPPASGINSAELGGDLFDHQSHLVRWALSLGRAAIFADTGLGKTIMQLEWARVVAEKKGRVLILAPLAVSEQTVREGARFGIDVDYARAGCNTEAPIVITNYEMVEHFDPSDFVGVVLDESSILKSYTGAFRNLLIGMFAETAYRLACTATPAPNDHSELGNHSEFLGVKSRTEMLAEFFVHDGGSTQNWRLKGHAEDAFWMWVSSWARVVRKPSDLGFSDEGYDLPPLSISERIVPVDSSDAQEMGLLFPPQAVTLSDQRATRRATTHSRVNAICEIDRLSPDAPLLVWCELNKESDSISEAIPDSVSVSGSDDIETKRDRLIGFSDGKYRVLVTKPKIAGYGMNWQHCSRVVFAGASHSYEQTYQAIRRCWRFGQRRPVDVTIVRASTEDAVIANYKRKEAESDRMAVSMMDHMRGVQMAGPLGVSAYNATIPMVIPSWVGEEN